MNIVRTLILIFLASGCAVTVSVQRTGLTVDGNVKPELNGSPINDVIRWYSSCDGYKERSAMVFPIIPMPPIIPIGDKVSLGTGDSPFYLFIETSNGQKLDKSQLKVALNTEGRQYVLINEYETYYVREKYPTIWKYKFTSDFRCKNVKDAELVIHWADELKKINRVRRFNVDYFDKNMWEWGYFRNN
ncbi:MAG: hypothetical protein OEZ58_10200 [Gammaproteobacteria bacterium]|nr:hypothetical protein [Gammaproteobacteria bacterium]MDH5729352.1 hypothetical protein [Gammaproteobacteria bacterium]